MFLRGCNVWKNIFFFSIVFVALRRAEKMWEICSAVLHGNCLFFYTCFYVRKVFPLSLVCFWNVFLFLAFNFRRFFSAMRESAKFFYRYLFFSGSKIFGIINPATPHHLIDRYIYKNLLTFKGCGDIKLRGFTLPDRTFYKFRAQNPWICAICVVQKGRSTDLEAQNLRKNRSVLAGEA